nr:chemotaxis protein CheW [Azospirillum picis]
MVVAVGDLRLALPLPAVSAVIRPPALLRIPLGPSSLDGLAQWQGEAVPVLDLSRALGHAGGTPAGARGRRVVLVLHRGQQVGLAVDAMVGILHSSADHIDPVATEDDGSRSAMVDPVMLDGVLREGPATILKTGLLIDRQFGDVDAAAARPVKAAGGAIGTPRSGLAPLGPAGAGGTDAALLVFGVAGQEFAIPVDRVREVLPAPREVARMARARAHLLGVMSVRDQLLPLVGLRALFGLDRAGDAADALSAGRRVVVVQAGTGHAPVGVLVDEVLEILRIAPGLIDPVPPLLAREPEFEDLDGIARADAGRRLVSVLSADRLFRHGAAFGDGAVADRGAEGQAAGQAARQAAEEDGKGMKPAPIAEEGAGHAGERFVVFRLAGVEYGLPVSVVREVLRRPDAVTPLPNAPDFVTGVLTLRGEVLPLIDQRRLLNLPAADAVGAGAAQCRVVVVGHGGAEAARVGLMVDSLSGLFTIPPERIGPAPAVSAAQRRLIRQVATLEDAGVAGSRLILLMEPESLLDMDRLAGLLVPSG